MFQLPVVVYFLTKAGIVTPSGLRQYRKIAIVIILVVSAVITPPDVISQILVALPLLILYEVGIKISTTLYKKQQKELDEM